jgi:XTP/dITP diphosphohydrolase
MTPQRIVVLASRNRGKAREFERLLGREFEVSPLPSSVALPDETGETFADNARLKAESVFAALGGKTAVLADDSGLEVSALGGRPGVRSARFAGESASDDANVGKLLAELAGRVDREARFVCALCLVMPGDEAAEEAGAASRLIEAEGFSRGSITLAPRGMDGFGYDPVFLPNGWEITLAEASPESKDAISHRGAAARALLARIANERGMGDGA